MSSTRTTQLTICLAASLGWACGPDQLLGPDEVSPEVSLVDVQVERRGEAIEARGFDENGVERAAAVWRPELDTVEVTLEGDPLRTTQLERHPDAGELDVSDEEQIEIWLRLVHGHRVARGNVDFGDGEEPNSSSSHATSRNASSRPIGSLDFASRGSDAGPGRSLIRVQGWSCDSSNFRQTVPIHIYATSFIPFGPSRPGTFVSAGRRIIDGRNIRASLRRPDVGRLCGNTVNHGFNFQAQNSCRRERAGFARVRAWGLDIDSRGRLINGNTNIVLNGRRDVNGLNCERSERAEREGDHRG